MNKLSGAGEFSDLDEMIHYTIEVLNNGHDVRIHPYRDGTYDIFELERKGQVPDMWPFKGTKSQ
jgi:hypothetical protein